MLKNPGRKLRSAARSSTATARACEPTAKSTTVFRLRAEAAARRPSFSVMTTMSPCPVSMVFKLNASPSAALTSAPAGRGGITAVAGLLQSHQHAVGCAAAVDHGEPHEAGPVRLEEQRAARG